MIEDLNTHIKDLQRMQNEVVEIRDLLRSLDEYADVYVDAPIDTSSFHIRVVCEDATDDLVGLCDTLGAATDIVYKPDSETYQVDGGFDSRV